MIASCGTATPATVAPAPAAPSQRPNGTPAATVVAATPTVAPVATEQPATSTPNAVVDLSGLDVCSLLTEADVQALTGTSVAFADQGSDDRCFWGATVPGEPQYVEVSVFGRSQELARPDVGPTDSRRPDPDATRACLFAEYGEYRPTPVFAAASLRVGDVVDGPAVVEEESTTIVVFPRSTLALARPDVYVMTVS